MKMQKLLPLISLLLVSCAYIRSDTSRTTTVTTNGIPVVVENTTMRGYALLEANQAVSKFSNRSAPVQFGTNCAFAPGTSIGNVNNVATDTGLTNVINLLKAISALSAGGAM